MKLYLSSLFILLLTLTVQVKADELYLIGNCECSISIVDDSSSKVSWALIGPSGMELQSSRVEVKSVADAIENCSYFADEKYSSACY